jgi:hypothetical protein
VGGGEIGELGSERIQPDCVGATSSNIRKSKAPNGGLLSSVKKLRILLTLLAEGVTRAFSSGAIETWVKALDGSAVCHAALMLREGFFRSKGDWVGPLVSVGPSTALRCQFVRDGFKARSNGKTISKIAMMSAY